MSNHSKSGNASCTVQKSDDKDQVSGIYPRAYNPSRGKNEEHWAGNHLYLPKLFKWLKDGRNKRRKNQYRQSGKYVQSNNTYIKIYSLNFSSPAHLIPKKKTSFKFSIMTKSYRNICTNLPYYCKHGIEVLTFSTMKCNFNKMFNNLHSFKLIWFS